MNKPDLFPVVTHFTRVGEYKLAELQRQGFSVAGVAIERANEDGTIERGAVTGGGMVLWWPPQPAQQAVEPVEWPHKWGCQANAFGECSMGCTAQQQAAERKRPPNCGTGFCSCVECVVEPDAKAELLQALAGVIRVADRKTDEFDAARAAFEKHGGKL